MRNRLAEYLRSTPLWIRFSLNFLLNMAMFGAVQDGLDAFDGSHQSMLHIAIGAAIASSVTTVFLHLAQRPAPDANDKPDDDQQEGVDR